MRWKNIKTGEVTDIALAPNITNAQTRAHVEANLRQGMVPADDVCASVYAPILREIEEEQATHARALHSATHRQESQTGEIVPVKQQQTKPPPDSSLNG